MVAPRTIVRRHDWLRGARHEAARDLLARHEPNIWRCLRDPPARSGDAWASDHLAPRAWGRSSGGREAPVLSRGRSAMDAPAGTFGGAADEVALHMLATTAMTPVGTIAGLFPHLLMWVGRSADAVLAADVGLTACKVVDDPAGYAQLCAWL